MALEPRDVAPADLAFVDAGGEEVPLSAFHGEAAVLIYLRHLGWLPCQDHLVQVAERVSEIPGRVACITFAEAAMLRGFERKMSLPYPVYGDPERRSYRAFGFKRASKARVWLDPRVWVRYAALLAGGRGASLQGGQDTLQLGGDLVLDAEGRLEWIYRSRGPEDRPRVDELAAAARRAAPRAA